MKKKVLIIGGAGFIGLNVAEYLGERRNYDITIGDNFYRDQKDEKFNKVVEKYNIKVIEEDFTNPAVFKSLENDYDYVYMLASVVGVSATLEFPHEIIRINTAIIYNTLEWLRYSKVKKALFTSTSECYSGTTDYFNYEIPTSEKVPLCIEEIGHPRFTYAVTKMLGESGFLNYSKKCDFETTIIRYNNVFGGRMGFRHVIPNLVQRFLGGENPFKIYGHDQTRSFCYISDAAEGTVLAMESKNSNQEIFHIGSTEEITIEELVRATGDIFNYEGSYTYAETYPGSVDRRCPDITKAKELLNFSIDVPWKDGLEKTVKWYVDFFQNDEKASGVKFLSPSDFNESKNQQN